MSESVDTENSGVLTWESRLALMLPGPPIIGVVLIAACLIAVYLSFVWLFGLMIGGALIERVVNTLLG